MPASIPSAVVHGDDIDTTLGPIADLTKCYFDGAVTFEAAYSAKQVIKDFNGHESAFVNATPTYSIKAPVIFKRETGTFATAHPGTGISRATVPVFADRVGHGFPADTGAAGYFMLGDMSSTIEVGQHRKCTLDLKLILFPITAAAAGAPA